MISKNRTYYLGGPMSGRPQFNFPMFEAVASMLRAEGYNIVSPHELDEDDIREAAEESVDGEIRDSFNGQTWGDFLSRDVKVVADQVDGVILLPGWESSRGARLESFVALCSGKSIYTYDPVEHVCDELTSEDVGRVLLDWAWQHAY